ncbi:hypothetical protein A33O_06195 [Nitratireductor aquibiodomus RA22]|uniref:Organic solvent tolerance-like N-terminal domain-containing protein n=1 Tax=Nitratireductor aquibiodomus RA22 TaxID=1189611 RepID=I5C335_9HYPH|nr:hypothetical protein A33O_06195 [Nitratireductor aquibiodomus RA22]
MIITSGSALAADDNSNLDRFEVSAEEITVDDTNVLHASGNVVLTDERTEIRLDKAKISFEDGKTIIDALAAK